MFWLVSRRLNIAIAAARVLCPPRRHRAPGSGILRARPTGYPVNKLLPHLRPAAPAQVIIIKHTIRAHTHAHTHMLVGGVLQYLLRPPRVFRTDIRYIHTRTRRLPTLFSVRLLLFRYYCHLSVAPHTSSYGVQTILCTDRVVNN